MVDLFVEVPAPKHRGVTELYDWQREVLSAMWPHCNFLFSLPTAESPLGPAPRLVFGYVCHSCVS